jgi:hypothetical protein
MKPEYLPKTKNHRLFHLIEECGEVLHFLGKFGRWGADSRHPNGGPTNAEAVLEECYDLRHANEAVIKDLEEYLNK